jgi:hypothetical protein
MESQNANKIATRSAAIPIIWPNPFIVVSRHHLNDSKKILDNAAVTEAGTIVCGTLPDRNSVAERIK